MNTTLQIRIDEDLKNQVFALYDSLGIDVSTAVRMFLKKSIVVNGIPFDVRNERNRTEVCAYSLPTDDVVEELEDDDRVSEMTLEEFDDLIAETRNGEK